MTGKEVQSFRITTEAVFLLLMTSDVGQICCFFINLARYFQKLPPSSYLFDTLKHIFYIVMKL